MSQVADIAAVDLFCGGGGLSHGRILEGVRVVAGYDLDESCRFAFESNNDAKFICKDVAKVTGSEVRKHLRHADVRVLVGCAPCTPFSPLQQGKMRWRERQWRLLKEFARLVDEVRPTVVSMENVPAVRSTGVFRSFVKTLEHCGYKLTWRVISCPDYGVPQTRRRLILLGSLLGSIELVPATTQKDRLPTVRQAIGGFEPLSHGQVSTSDKLHCAPRLTPINLRRMKASRPGGSWRDWPKSLRLACHRRKKGRKYSGVYGRMLWDRPGPTITTQSCNYGSGRFGHPRDHRAITPREAAALQTFPADYKFFREDCESLTSVKQMIGNAVPVMLARAIGKSIVRHVEATLG